MKIFVGGLSPEVTDEDLRKEFVAFGQVESAEVVLDRVSRMSRGFGFVEMPVKSEGIAAITGLNGHELMGNPLTVNEARPPAPRGSREGGGGGHRRGGGGGGGGRDRDRGPRSGGGGRRW